MSLYCFLSVIRMAENEGFSPGHFVKLLCTIVQGLLSNFKNSLKIRKKSKFNRNQLKPETQHKDMYMYQKKYKNGEFSPSHF